MKKSKIAFCPADQANEKPFQQLEKSLRKFHIEEDLPLRRYDLANIQDPTKWYKAKPLIARELLKEYEYVIGLDADQIITGDLSDIWQGEFDVACVLNDPTYPAAVWDISPYFNNGLVVLKSEEFVNHWWRLCQSEHFPRYQFREQDILNILASNYHNYKVKCLDTAFVCYGEFGKPFWAQATIKYDKIYIPNGSGEAELKVIHFGGGDDPSKGNYKIRFSPEVIKKIEWLIE